MHFAAWCRLLVGYCLILPIILLRSPSFRKHDFMAECIRIRKLCIRILSNSENQRPLCLNSFRSAAAFRICPFPVFHRSPRSCVRRHGFMPVWYVNFSFSLSLSLHAFCALSEFFRYIYAFFIVKANIFATFQSVEMRKLSLSTEFDNSFSRFRIRLLVERVRSGVVCGCRVPNRTHKKEASLC